MISKISATVGKGRTELCFIQLVEAQKNVRQLAKRAYYTLQPNCNLSRNTIATHTAQKIISCNTNLRWEWLILTVNFYEFLKVEPQVSWAEICFGHNFLEQDRASSKPENFGNDDIRAVLTPAICITIDNPEIFQTL